MNVHPLLLQLIEQIIHYGDKTYERKDEFAQLETEIESQSQNG
jgi:cell division protein FtsL